MTGDEILGYFKNGGFGGGAPDCRRRLSGVQGPQAPAGVKGRSPFASLLQLIAGPILDWPLLPLLPLWAWR